MASLHHLRSTEMIEATSGDQRLLGSTNPTANETQTGERVGIRNSWEKSVTRPFLGREL